MDTVKTAEELKENVRNTYAQVASQSKEANAASCCGAGGCSTEVYNIMSDDYTGLKGYAADADLGLGCGLPTETAGIKPGSTVLDLGSGAGNDAFVARAATGPDGRVIGVDFTPEMIAKAKENAVKLGFANVEFRQGDIEALPLSADMVDVVVSNCVLNLVPDKKKAFAEMHRVLRKGGHFSVSDVVLSRALPDELRQAAELYAGCVTGASQESDYMGMIAEAGFTNVNILKRKAIIIPSDILSRYLSPEAVETVKTRGLGIESITVYGEKSTETKCCEPNAEMKEKVVVATGEDCGCGIGSSCC
ncbi:MAG: arsenite methyltransferase [Flavobacteriales bacterium]